MTVTEIKTLFGAYYKAGSAGMTDLYRLLYLPTTTEQVFTPVLTDSDIYQASSSSVTRLLQPFQKSWTPTGTLSFKPAEIRMHKMKMDFEDTPDDLESSWLGFLAGQGLKRTEWPFVKWLMEAHLVPQLREELELTEIYKGVRVEPTAGTPGGAGTGMDGLEKNILTHIAGGRITPIVMGAAPTVPVEFVEYVEDFVAQISERYQNTSMPLLMSPKHERLFKKGMREKYNMNYAQADTAMVIDTAITVKGLNSMIGKDRLICTPAENVKYLRKRNPQLNQFEVEGVDRKVKIFADFFAGTGLVLPEACFNSDVA